MASETDIHRRLYLRHAKMVVTEEQTNPRHPARHVTGALFVRNSLLLRGKAAKVHRMFFTIQS